MPSPDPSAVEAEHSIVRGLWRALDIFRVLALVYAVWAVWVRFPQIARPGVAVGVLAVLAAWTVAQTVWPCRTVRAYAAELALACSAILATRLVDHDWVITAGAKTVPSLWSVAPVVGFAVLRGWRGGLAAAVVVSTSSFVEVVDPTPNTVSNSIFVLLLGWGLGYVVDLARSGHAAHTEALRLEAARHERERLARTVHDGVLQTLAHIHRTGLELGGEAARLGAMAAEQERVLRSLVSGADLGTHSDAAGPSDLRVSLCHLEREAVQLVTPSEPVHLPPGVAAEVAAAVEAAVDNVRRHAGEGARAWVLLDHDGSAVRVTIRDTGRGVTEARLAEALSEGRLGVATSIRARIADLGGTAEVRSRPGVGTTVELRVPVRGEVG